MDPLTLPRPEWTPLPTRARTMFVFDNVLLFGSIGVGLGIASFTILGIALSVRHIWILSIVLGLIGIGIGVWRGTKVYRSFRWKLDENSLDIRKGHLWQKELRVPVQRVQHLNLSRGPLQRSRQLATLTIYTAGTANSSIKLPNMDSDMAEAIREHLSALIDWVDE